MFTAPPASPADHGLPWPVRAFNFAAQPLARSWLRLEADDLLRRARARAGLDDFGGNAFETPLRILVAALESEAGLHPLGRVAQRSQILDLLVMRLRVQDLLARRPEIRAERIDRPIVILGLPRTGTTLLHRLLARDAGLRSLPFWEGIAPLPDGDATRPADPAPRIRRAEQRLRFLYWCVPQMRAMHEIEAQEPEEELTLLAFDFATLMFEAMACLPSYREWYDSADLTASYGFLRTLLQVLQWYRRGERWLLKSPQHLGQLGPLLSAFPDATIVQTHRDPVTVTASVCNMIAYGARMSLARPQPAAIARYWAARVETLLRRSRERPAAHARQFVDVQFGELMADPLAIVRRIYAAAERELTPSAEAAMRAYLAANPRGKHGAHSYRLESLGLDPAERRAALRDYQQRFQVPDE
ncbi:MAG: sulfotransferase [Deltaproteobacteria bacterium]|nr:sulfotransferase [Deltaproteobacteria bacterium]